MNEHERCINTLLKLEGAQETIRRLKIAMGRVMANDMENKQERLEVIHYAAEYLNRGIKHLDETIFKDACEALNIK